MSGNSIGLVVFDWAGTTVDFGSLAPIEAFVEVFARRGVVVSRDEARKPMGTHKRDHLRMMLSEPAIAARWTETLGKPWGPVDLERMYQELVPIQLETIDRHDKLVPGLLDVLAELRKRGVKIAGTTGYFRAAAERIAQAAARQGYTPDANVCGDDVPAGRPAPWMVYRCMEATGVYPPWTVLKVGDTLPDIHEGRNAGVWSVGITDSSSEVALAEADWRALPEAEKASHRQRVGALFGDAGAHGVIATLADLPALIEAVEARLKAGERPSG